MMKNNIEELKIENEYGKIISRFPVLHHNWECDGLGYIVEKEGKRSVILSDHGKSYISSVEELHLKISDYKGVIQETERALFLLK